MKSITIIFTNNSGSLDFYASKQEKRRLRITDQEMEYLYNWLVKEECQSHIVTCNDETKIILIRNSISYVECK